MNSSNSSADCCSALLRVHLPGYHVFPVLLLRPWTRARFDLDSRHRRIGFIHFFDSLVSSEMPYGFSQHETDFLVGNSA